MKKEINPGAMGRRKFLRINTFAIAAAALANSCRLPVRHAIPYLVQPHDIIPGKAVNYASALFDGMQFSGILAKVRDGRPVKIEGNDLCPLSRGASNARIQASLLELYNPDRLREPEIEGNTANWAELDGKITTLLRSYRDSGKKVIVLSRSIISPTEQSVLDQFRIANPTSEVICYDELSSFAIPEAHRLCFGSSMFPSYRFDQARMIVGFNADFLGSYLSPVEFTLAYNQSKTKNGGFSHVQFEPHITITGSKADRRHSMDLSEEVHILSSLYNELVSITGAKLPLISAGHPLDIASDLARELTQHQNESLVISGTNSPDIQILINAVNYLLGNYGHTVDMENPVFLRSGNDNDLSGFLNYLENGERPGIIFFGTDPVYDLGGFPADRISNLEFTVMISVAGNDTSPYCRFVCPSHHGLESWNDFIAGPEKVHFAQPLVSPLFNSRQGIENFLVWSGLSGTYGEYLKNRWNIQYQRLYGDTRGFLNYWDQCLGEGIINKIRGEITVSQNINMDAPGKILVSTEQAGIELEIYEKTNIGTGLTANNPWLQELPDPLTRISWQNYALVSPAFASGHNLAQGDIILINEKVEIPVVVMEGQADHTVSVAWGYGRKNAGVIASGIGASVSAFTGWKDGFRSYQVRNITIRKTGVTMKLPAVQGHFSVDIGDLLGKGQGSAEEPAGHASEQSPSFYEPLKHEGHRWAMTLDLDRCTGCNACVIACQAENNIPVVGPEEILRRHEMHWIKVDRYSTNKDGRQRITFLPVMCQHCENAPCENVCPVAATTHSKQGINQMVYNRCIGTRYCSNNCPYKVRVFNWFDYTGTDSWRGNEHPLRPDPEGLYRLVLNPDVVVRSRGVMEKCSFCIQRIEEKTTEAKSGNKLIADGGVQTACMQVCPARAITFGDLNREDSQVGKTIHSPGIYRLLNELNTMPSVYYIKR